MASDDVTHMLDSLCGLLLPHVGAIFIAPGFRTRPGEIIGGATAALIATGNREILITCQHVIEEFRNQKHSNDAALLALFLGTNQTIELPDPEGRIIDEQPEPLDLVSLRYSGLSSPHYPEKAYFALDLDQEVTVACGDTVVFLGFPGGDFRKAVGCLATLKFMPIALVVTDVSASTILAAGIGDNAEVFTDMGDKFGGFSGSPVFLPRPGKPFALIGFVRACSSLAGGCLMISPSRYLRSDGTFAWPGVV
jgi:hypothetical protein